MERAHRTHTEEFYEVYDGDLEVPVLDQALQRWEYIYNHIRPYQALDGRTPKECHPELAPQITVSYVVNEYSLGDPLKGDPLHSVDDPLFNELVDLLLRHA